MYNRCKKLWRVSFTQKETQHKIIFCRFIGQLWPFKNCYFIGKTKKYSKGCWTYTHTHIHPHMDTHTCSFEDCPVHWRMLSSIPVPPLSKYDNQKCLWIKVYFILISPLLPLTFSSLSLKLTSRNFHYLKGIGSY